MPEEPADVLGDEVGLQRPGCVRVADDEREVRDITTTRLPA
jgi:hypothetical protein